MRSSVVMSDCGAYRYELRRIWDEKRPAVLFVCLNPSTADAETEDNTSRVCINYAKSWGYGALFIGNLFALRSTDPAALSIASDPVGPENDRYISKLHAEAAMTICAWGDGGALFGRDVKVLQGLSRPHCISRLKSGRPGHPLYKSAALVPRPL